MPGLFTMAFFLLAQPPQTTDPFEGLDTPKSPQPEQVQRPSFFQDNFGFRKEVLSQFTTTSDGNPAGRMSLGFEVLKKFSSATSTFASFNTQIRFVRRDRFNPVQNDMEGSNRKGWALEYHNVYMDFYNVFGPVGKFNIRAGRFYVPFGLNLQTDTHGTVLQLSNERNFGFERDWYTGFWGSINRHLNYDAYYSAGSGYAVRYKGQSGLASVRLSLANLYSSRYGLEAGFSTMAGERLPMHGSMMYHPTRTRRIGFDARYRRPIPNGLLSFTQESSGGSDNRNALTMHLHQIDYLHRSRRWGLASQYRRYRQSLTDSSLIAEATWFLRNDVGNSNLHWLKFNVERRLGSQPPHTIVAVQYYFYR